jgi:hypothetical protein
MAIKLNLEPTDPLTYKRAVAIPTPDGKPLKIEFTFKHRTREELAALFDAYLAKAKAAADEEADTERVSLVEATKAAIARDVEAVLDVASDWNVDKYPFDAESLTKFLSIYPGAAVAIATDYRVSHTEGRLGN